MVAHNESLDSATFLENKISISSTMLPKYLDAIALMIYTTLWTRVCYKSKGGFDFQSSPVHYFWISRFRSLKNVVTREISDSVLAPASMQNFSVFQKEDSCLDHWQVQLQGCGHTLWQQELLWRIGSPPSLLIVGFAAALLALVSKSWMGLW